MIDNGMSLEDLRNEVNLDLQELGMLDKYDVVLTTNAEDEQPTDDTGKMILNIDSILVESEHGDTLKDIEDAIIEFIKQYYSDKEIFSITTIEHEDEHNSKETK